MKSKDYVLLKSLYYDNKEEWKKMMDRAMAKDFSWNNSARQYEEMYNWLIKK